MRQNLRSGKGESGASTITMQVVRLARKNRKRTYLEKLKEAALALRLEARRSKKEILALFAAHAPFGGNVVGIDAASWLYFGRRPPGQRDRAGPRMPPGPGRAHARAPAPRAPRRAASSRHPGRPSRRRVPVSVLRRRRPAKDGEKGRRTARRAALRPEHPQSRRRRHRQPRCGRRRLYRQHRPGAAGGIRPERRPPPEPAGDGGEPSA